MTDNTDQSKVYEITDQPNISGGGGDIYFSSYPGESPFEVAIKIPNSFVDYPEAVTNHEAEIAKRMQNIGYGLNYIEETELVIDGEIKPALIMERLNDSCFWGNLQYKNIDDFLEVNKQIAAARDEADKVSITTDWKPDSLWYGPDGRIVILDHNLTAQVDEIDEGDGKKYIITTSPFEEPDKFGGTHAYSTPKNIARIEEDWKSYEARKQVEHQNHIMFIFHQLFRIHPYAVVKDPINTGDSNESLSTYIQNQLKSQTPRIDYLLQEEVLQNGLAQTITFLMNRYSLTNVDLTTVISPKTFSFNSQLSKRVIASYYDEDESTLPPNAFDIFLEELEVDVDLPIEAKKVIAGETLFDHFLINIVKPNSPLLSDLPDETVKNLYSAFATALDHDADTPLYSTLLKFVNTIDQIVVWQDT